MSQEHDEHIRDVQALDGLIRKIGITAILDTCADELQNESNDAYIQAIGRTVYNITRELDKLKRETDFDDKKVSVPV